MKFLLPFLSIIGLSLFCCAQVPVKNIFVYKTERLPGTVRVNEKGEQVRPKSFITYQAYVESAGHVNWQKVWIKGRSYTITVTEIKQFPVTVGKYESNEKDIVLKFRRGARLFKCDLIEDNHTVIAPSSAKPGKMLLKGTYKNKILLKTIDKVVNLYVEPSV